MLGFLANLRDLKASLTSGMILLSSVWLIFSNEISQVRAGDSMAGNVARLVEFLGPIATLGVLSFIAYFIGLILSLDQVVLRLSRWTQNGRQDREQFDRATIPLLSEFLGFYFGSITTIVEYVKKSFSQRASSKWDFTAPPFRSERLITFVRHKVDTAATVSDISTIVDALTFGLSYGSRGKYTSITHHGQSAATPEDRKGSEKERVVLLILEEIREDIDILAVQLGHKLERSYDRFEKARSEAEFRAAIVIPTLILTIIVFVRLVSEGSPPWATISCMLIGLFGPAILTFKAYNKMLESEEEVINAILLGEVQVSQLQILDRVERVGDAHFRREPDLDPRRKKD